MTRKWQATTNSHSSQASHIYRFYVRLKEKFAENANVRQQQKTIEHLIVNFELFKKQYQLLYHSKCSKTKSKIEFWRDFDGKTLTYHMTSKDDKKTPYTDTIQLKPVNRKKD